MSHKRNDNNNNKKKPQPQLVLNNSSKNPKKIEKRKQQNINIQQNNRNSKQNSLLFSHGDLKQLEKASAVTSPGLYSTSSEDHENIHIQLAIQQSLQAANMSSNVNNSTINPMDVSNDAIGQQEDELEADFYDITSSDCEEEVEEEEEEEEEDIENWELLDESSSSLVNLNKPYSFSNIEFPVLAPKSTSGNPNANQSLNNPWLNSKVLIKSISQQS